MSISSLVSWLSKHFPEKLEVSMQEYKELREEMGQYNRAVQAVVELNTRLSVVESEVKRLNTANGFVNNAKGSFSLER